MTTVEPFVVIAWKAFLLVLLAATLICAVAAQWPSEPASRVAPPRIGNPFAGPILRTA